MFVEWLLGSLVELVTLKRVSSLTVWVGITPRTGATFTSCTMTVKLLLAVNCGFRASEGLLLVTTGVTVLVPGLWFWLGVQVMTPLTSIVMPAGAFSSP